MEAKTEIEFNPLFGKLINAVFFGDTKLAMHLLDTLEGQDALLRGQQIVLHYASKAGHVELLEAVLKKFPTIDLNEKHNHTKDTALYTAIDECQVDVVKFFLSKPETDLGLRSGSYNPSTLLFMARVARHGLPGFDSKRKEILLLLRTPEVGARSVKSSLAKQDMQGALQMLYHLYGNEGFDDEITDGIQRLRSCLKLLEYELSPQDYQILCEKLLNHMLPHIAERKTDDDNKLILDLLILSRININQLLKDKSQNSVLHRAVQAGNLSLIIELFSTFPSIDVNIQNGEGKTAIFYCDCVEESGVKILNYLLDKKADPAIVSNSGFTPLMDAVIHRLDDAYVQVLIDSKKELNVNQIETQDGYTAFTWAVVNLDLNMATLLLQIKEVDVNAKLSSKNHQGQTALHNVVKHDHKELVNLLLNREEINVNAIDDNGFSPIFFANSPNVLTALLKRRASVSIISKTHHITPLMTMLSSADLIKILINSGQDLNVNELAIHEGQNNAVTALMLATTISDHEILALVLTIDKVNVNIKDMQGQTALHHAVHSGDVEHVRLLLARSEIEVDARDVNRMTALDHANKIKYVDHIRLLFGEIEVDARDVNNMTALDLASKIKSDSSGCSNDIIRVIELLNGFKNSFAFAKSSLENNDIETAASELFDFCDGGKNLSIVINNHLYHLKKAFPSTYKKLVLQIVEVATKKDEPTLASEFLSLISNLNKNPSLSPLRQYSKFPSNQTNAQQISQKQQMELSKQETPFTI